MKYAPATKKKNIHATYTHTHTHMDTPDYNKANMFFKFYPT